HHHYSASARHCREAGKPIALRPPMRCPGLRAAADGPRHRQAFGRTVSSAATPQHTEGPGPRHRRSPAPGPQRPPRMNTTPDLATPDRWHRPLVATSVGFAALTVFALAATIVDDRTLLGEPVWTKVFKFALAFTVHNFTLAWLIRHMTRARRFGWWAGTAFAAISVPEVGVIVMAA